MDNPACKVQLDSNLENNSFFRAHLASCHRRQPPEIVCVHYALHDSHLSTAGIFAVPVSAKSFINSDRRCCTSSRLVISPVPPPASAADPVTAEAPPVTPPLTLLVLAGEPRAWSIVIGSGGGADNFVTFPFPGAT